jgi:hypothetical protein
MGRSTVQCSSSGIHHLGLVVKPRRHAPTQQFDEFFAHPGFTPGIPIGNAFTVIALICPFQRTIQSIGASSHEFSVALDTGI